jgi:hypothetical protein
MPHHQNLHLIADQLNIQYPPQYGVPYAIINGQFVPMIPVNIGYPYPVHGQIQFAVPLQQFVQPQPQPTVQFVVRHPPGYPPRGVFFQL